MIQLRFRLCIALAVCVTAVRTTSGASSGTAVSKLNDIVIYQDDKFYCSFPSIVRRPDGELLVAFRRAPERRALGEASTGHTDPNSYLVLVRSRDDGKTWTKSPELIYANPFGGSQDPCMVQLHDDSIICTSYGWALLNGDAPKKLSGASLHGNFVFLGGYLLRSKDGGHNWENPIYPPSTPDESAYGLFGKAVPAYNRGALCEGKDRRLYWVVASTAKSHPGKSATHLFISADHGSTWTYSCPVASDDKVGFNETSVYETPKGELVAFMRTDGLDDHTAIARSTNHGKSFQLWRDAGFQGHPHYALRLPDKRVLLIYGYRHSPFGVRARVLDSDCEQIESAEFVLRDDGGNGDVGYPWAAMLSKHRALVVYYFNKGNGGRYIAGSFLAVE